MPRLSSEEVTRLAQQQEGENKQEEEEQEHEQEQEEPSLLEYARFYHLARDHLSGTPPLECARRLLGLSTPSWPKRTTGADSRDICDADPCGIVTEVWAANDGQEPEGEDEDEDERTLSQLFAPHLPTPFKLREKLHAPKAAAVLLSSLLRALSPVLHPGTNDPDNASLLLPPRHRIRSLKHDLPVLRSDPEVDLRRFAAGFELDVRELRRNIPLEKIDEEADEGLGWPARVTGLVREVARGVQREKIGGGREGLVFLTGIVRGGESGRDDEDGGVGEEEEMVKKNRKTKYVLEPVTPPLLPLSTLGREPAPAFLPSSPTRALELVSGTSSPQAAKELREIEEQVFEDEYIGLERTKHGDGERTDAEASSPGQQRIGEVGCLYAPLRSIQGSSPPTMDRAVLAYGQKVEGPLTPPLLPASNQPHADILTTPSGPASIPALLASILSPPLLPSPLASPTTATGNKQHGEHGPPSSPTTAFINNTLKPLAAKANRLVEQEQLVEADATKRVDVPAMDFALPTPPWKTFLVARGKSSRARAGSETAAAWGRVERPELEMQMHMIEDMVCRLRLKDGVWPGAKRVERELRWTPFPLGRGRAVDVREEIVGDEELIEGFLVGALPRGVVGEEKELDSCSLVWKPEGLRFLKEGLRDVADDEDEELERWRVEGAPEGNELREQAMKRRLRADDEEKGDNDGDDNDDNHVGSTSTRKKDVASTAHSRTQPLADVPREGIPATSMLDTHFSATSALQQFMEIRGQGSKRRRLTQQSPHFGQELGRSPSERQQKQLDSNAATKNQAGADGPVWTQREGSTSPCPVKEIFLPLPKPDTPSPPPPSDGKRPFIFSSAFLAQERPLMRRIEQLCPWAEIIERDFSSSGGGGSAAILKRRQGSRNPPTTISQLPQQTLGVPPDEADVLLSPSAALVATTLQRIKQRALPGQAARVAGIRERITRLQGRYERLIVLVSEGRIESAASSSTAAGLAKVSSAAAGPVGQQVTTSGLEAADCAALVELMASAAGLAGAVEVVYVGGGREELASWVVGLMGRYGMAGQAVTLTQEEATWELFLRRMGMNAFAAQVVLSELRSETEARRTPGKVDMPSGLAAFVGMSLAERLRRFEYKLGGRKALLRVSEALDARWQ